MALPAARSTAVFQLPPSQNTAPVLDFRCLYTRDLRRKAKRWQDGYLRFHTFNKRIMVYDEQRNFVGDSHWTGSEDVQDGDELNLDRSGVMVEIAEFQGSTQTDLSGLLSRNKPQQGQDAGCVAGRVARAQPPQQAHSNSIAALAPLRTVLASHQPNSNAQQSLAQVRSVVNTPGRPRDDENHIPLWEILKTSRPPKAKTPIRPLRPAPATKPPPKTRPAETRPPEGQARLKVKELIDLTSSDSRSLSARSPALVPQPLRSEDVPREEDQTVIQRPAEAEPIEPAPRMSNPVKTKRKANRTPAAESAQQPSPMPDPSPPRKKQRASLESKKKKTATDTGKENRTTRPTLGPAKPALENLPLPRLPPSSPPVSTIGHLPSPGNAPSKSPLKIWHTSGNTREDHQERATEPLRVRSTKRRPMLMCCMVPRDVAKANKPPAQDDASHSPDQVPQEQPQTDSGLSDDLPSHEEPTSNAAFEDVLNVISSSPNRDSQQARNVTLEKIGPSEEPPETDDPNHCPPDALDLEQLLDNDDTADIDMAIAPPPTEGAPAVQAATADRPPGPDTPAQEQLPPDRVTANPAPNEDAPDPTKTARAVSAVNKPFRRPQRAKPAAPSVMQYPPALDRKPSSDIDTAGLTDDQGAWTREAWDLFGCGPPAARAVRPVSWDYGVPRAEAEARDPG